MSQVFFTFNFELPTKPGSFFKRKIENMGKASKKVVTNLLEDISKARDIIARGDVKEIRNKLFLFQRVDMAVARQLNKFLDDKNYELDFTCEDLKELSDETYNFIREMQKMFKYDELQKQLMALAVKKTPLTDKKYQEIPVDNAIFKEFSDNLMIYMAVDANLREFYKRIAYSGVTIFLECRTEARMSFDEQVTSCIRSFL